MRNLIILFLIFIIPTKALGLIEVDITRGNLNPLPIAVSPLSIDDESKKSFEKTLKKKDNFSIFFFNHEKDKLDIDTTKVPISLITTITQNL